MELDETGWVEDKLAISLANYFTSNVTNRPRKPGVVEHFEVDDF